MTSAGHRILVCDDEADVREMLQEYLQRRGFEVKTAGNAVELRERLETGRIDLIVLDINMPGEDGLSALRALRADNPVPVEATADRFRRFAASVLDAGQQDTVIAAATDLADLPDLSTFDELIRG